MLVIQAQVKESETHGLGLFAEEAIEKGQLVIKPSTAGLDIELDNAEFEKLSKHEQDFISHYGFHNKHTGKHHLTFDNTRFINHSEKGNISLDRDTGNVYAKRNIGAGEELTQDYSEFEDIRQELQD